MRSLHKLMKWRVARDKMAVGPLVTVVMALGMRMPLSYPRIENSVPGTRGGGRGKGGRCRVLSMVATNGSSGGLLMRYCYILLLKNPLKPPEFLVLHHLHPHLMMLFGTEILSIIEKPPYSCATPWISAGFGNFHPQARKVASKLAVLFVVR